MKQIIILLLIIIASFIGYGKYEQHQRFNTPKVNYKTDASLDINYYNKDIVYRYYNAIEDLNSFVMLQNSANNIDVRKPEDDDEKTKAAVKIYADKLAKIKYYEAFLAQSNALKQQNLTNADIKDLETKGIALATQNKIQEINKIKSLFDANKKINYGQKSALIYEVQKILVAKGFEIKVDGIYKIETQNAIKNFESKNNLFADGELDTLTLDALFKAS